ncbi:MAG TPA: phage tail protein [Candidatus Cloacimonas sp.]|jgi:carboxyl-terminal processing protease|nr:carboxyl-terminal processing protease [Candidatus Cloacimonadota bacterium]HCX72593.1 phage tail protein [Candidatus Cloacimonas sp.]
MNKLSKIILSVSLIGWALVGILFLNSSTVVAENDAQSSNVYKQMRLFNEVLFKLRDNYVEELDMQRLIDAAIEGMLDETDPHTNFFTPDEFEQFSTDTKGEFGGLGITISKKGDYITVVSPMEGTPAYRVGILSGDKIAKVDGESMVGVSTNEAIKKMRGEKGTKVELEIIRPGVEEPLNFEIVRDIIKIDSVPYSFKLDDGIGYIRIRQFNANTTEELRSSLDELETAGIRGLVIDLRFNPGGLLREAVNTVNEFVGKNKLVVFTKGRIPRANQEYYTRYNRQRSGYPIVVLINEGSASASEIFAGSMQDYDRALVVGKTSFGKGSVQNLIPLSDGNAIKITTAKYYIKSGRCIHKELNDKLLKDERYRNGDYSKEELEEMRQELEEKTHNKVFYTVGGRKVYGGGGITPDIEIDNDLLTDLGVELRRKNTFFNFSVEYMLENEDTVTEDFEADQQLVQDFLKFAETKDIKCEETAVDSCYSWIQTELTSNIIGRKFGETASYKISLREDDQLQEALDLFDKYDTLPEMFDYAAKIKESKKEEKDE